ncbi:MAG: helix-turn-helix transcriptional regulator [Gemmatimonadetes bacterium]|nr:helix-turn-helix transcriptional regulator [Gemmatimonadota bacterium]NNM04050.1 helix-turn-helix transcriptional regulator [Gemmatimonadota bacterium]
MGDEVIRNQIRRLRFENGEMTQQQLGDLAGCTRQTIIALEQGGYVPSLALAFRVARAFGLGVEDVFEFVPDEDRPEAED